MRIIAAILWLFSIALTGLAAYAYQFKGLKLYLLIFTALGCLLCMSVFTLLTAPVRYKVGNLYFKHHPITTLLLSTLGVMLPFAIVTVAIVFQWLTSKSDPQLTIAWSIAATLCNIYAAVSASRALNSLQ